jgi:hypothetical protein
LTSVKHEEPRNEKSIKENQEKILRMEKTIREMEE